MIQRLNQFITAKPRLFAILLVGIIALPVLAHVYNGQFARMLADDYCFGNIANIEGLWGSFVYWFENWAGGHSGILAQSAVALTGTAGLLPSLLLVLWLVSFIWAIYEFWMLCGLRYPVFFAFFLGSLILYSIVLGIPNVYQAIYWTSGSITYTAPMVAIVFDIAFVLFLIRRQLTGLRLALGFAASAVVAFIAGGFSETTVALLTVIMVLALLASWRFLPSETKRGGVSLFLAGLIGAVIALVLMIAAPGNAIREAAHPTTRSLIHVGLVAAENTAAFIAIQLAFFSLIPILVCLILSAMATYQLQPLLLQTPLRFKTALKWMGISAAVGAFLIMASLSPAAFGMGKMPASRAWVVPQTLLILVVVSWGFAIGLSLQKRQVGITISVRAAAIALVLLVIGPIVATLSTLSYTDELRTFATEWDARDQNIRSAVASGNTNVTLTPYSVDLAKYATLDVVDEMATSDYTVCLQDYYGLESVNILEQTEGST